MKPRKTWGGWFVAIATGWVQVCCVYLQKGDCSFEAAGLSLFQADREIERSRDRESRVIWPKGQGDLFICCAKREPEKPRKSVLPEDGVKKRYEA